MRSRRTLLLVASLCLFAHTALAQDRLFVQVFDGTPSGRTVEIGAIGRFGQPIGPAPSDAFTHVFPAARHFVVLGNAIVEAANGAVVYTAPAGETIAGWAATPDATRLYVATFAGFARTTRAVDVGSRAVVAEAPEVAGTIVWLPGDRVVVDRGTGQYQVFDRELRSLGQFTLSSLCQPQWSISQHTGRAYVITTAGYNQNFYYTFSLVAFDTVAGRKVGEVNLTETLGVGTRSCYGAGVALWAAPGPPQRLAAAVLGRDVTLSWLATDLAEGYVLDVGLAPARTDLSFFVGGSTRVTFASVPPGVYYVRVRAGNVVGGGRPSQEVQIVVS